MNRTTNEHGVRVALILAAGASSRMGGRPKATLPVGGEPAVRRLARLSRVVGFFPTVVVGVHGPEIRKSLEGDPSQVVDNPSWEAGRTGSVQVGLQAAGETEEVLLWPVDHPFVQAMTLVRLCTVAERDAMGVWFIPTFEGRGGHPVLLRTPVTGRILRMRPDEPLRRLIPEFGPQVVRIPTSDPGPVADVSTPADYSLRLREYLARGGERWTGG